MTKQIARIIDLSTGETTERELTQAEIADLASTKSVAEMQAEQSTPIVIDETATK
jgi:hypothetical protein